MRYRASVRHRRDSRYHARRELALQIEVVVAWYRMIALPVKLMNISAVTIFLARVVVSHDLMWPSDAIFSTYCRGKPSHAKLALALAAHKTNKTCVFFHPTETCFTRLGNCWRPAGNKIALDSQRRSCQTRLSGLGWTFDKSFSSCGHEGACVAAYQVEFSHWITRRHLSTTAPPTTAKFYACIQNYTKN